MVGRLAKPAAIIWRLKGEIKPRNKNVPRVLNVRDVGVLSLCGEPT